MPRFFFVLLCVDEFKIRAKFVLSIKWFQPPLLHFIRRSLFGSCTIGKLRCTDLLHFPANVGNRDI